jgi:hypothetical protein
LTLANPDGSVAIPGAAGTRPQVRESHVYTQNPKVEEAPLQGELMLFDPETSKFYVLNRTMAFVWRRCDGSHTPEAMLEGLRQEFAEVEPAHAEADLRAALAELVSLGLVVDSRRPAPVT